MSELFVMAIGVQNDAHGFMRIYFNQVDRRGTESRNHCKIAKTILRSRQELTLKQHSQLAVKAGMYLITDKMHPRV